MKTQRTTLYYFSGTGNTKIVSELLTKEMAKAQGCMSILKNVEDALSETNSSIRVDADLIGIAYPIYGFGVPEIIRQFVERLEPVSAGKVFILMTGADYISINHNATASIRRKLKVKGYEVFYERIIVMGSNWLSEYEDALVRQLYQAARRKVKHMSMELQSEVKRIYEPSVAIKTFAKMTHFCEEQIGAKVFGKFLKASDHCNRCGNCVKHCPSHNISLEGNQIKFGNKCFMCMRCIYACTEKAIEPKIGKIVVLKNGYNIEKVICSEIKDEPLVETKLNGNSKHFRAYLKEDTM